MIVGGTEENQLCSGRTGAAAERSAGVWTTVLGPEGRQAAVSPKTLGGQK